MSSRQNRASAPGRLRSAPARHSAEPVAEPEPELFPMFLKLSGRLCLVVGAGRVAEPKIESLLRCGARVRVVAPSATAAIREAASAGRLVWEQRAFDACRSRRRVPGGRCHIFSGTSSAAFSRWHRNPRSCATRWTNRAAAISTIRRGSASRPVADCYLHSGQFPVSGAAPAARAGATIWSSLWSLGCRDRKSA